MALGLEPPGGRRQGLDPRLSLGHVLPLNRRVAVYFNGAVQHGRGRTDAAVDFGFRQAFSL